MYPSEEIKEKINIVDLIGEYVQLKKAGVNFRSVCPFHQEKTPSFLVSPSKQIWHCFGCGLGGDIFEFIKQIEGVEFPEALHMLAARAGVMLKKPTVEYQKETDQKKTLYAINELAARYFAKVLEESQSAKGARDYLAKRGLRPDTIQKWQLGYSPDDFHTFENFIVNKGFQKKEAAEAGLLVRKDETGEYFDRFRGRVMFPLFDIHGRVVGFTARILQDAEGVSKYINSPETAIYSKSHLVYGLHLAKSEIRKAGQVIVVEGNMDVITCHEAAPTGGQATGFGNVVGSSGTAFTTAQLEALKRFTPNLVFAFDVDEAGLLATRRAVELALSLGFNVRILSIPKSLAKDPDELVRRDRGLWEQQVRSAKNFLDFYFDAIFANIDLESAVEKKQVVADLLPLLSLLPDPIDRSHYTKQISGTLGVDERILLELLNRKLRSPEMPKQPQGTPPSGNKKSKREVLERRVLGLLLKFGENLAEDWKEVQVEHFSTLGLQEIYRAARERIYAEKFELKSFLTDNPKLAPEIELLLFAVDNELNAFPDWSLQDMKQQFLGNFKLEILKEHMNRISMRIKQAEHVGRMEEAKVLSGEFNNLTRELAKYHAR
ncbi:MAG: DNA primase [bacterium]|nr:DNA primase [bacterium]